ncbi:hypothetical protein NBRC116493_35700 [Aurantivibrio infirmus]
MLMKNLLVTPLIAMLMGCATTSGSFVKNEINSACIRGDFANFSSYLSKGESFVYITKIDGVIASNSARKQCTSPGKHIVEFRAVARDDREVVYIVEVELERQTEYQLKVQSLDENWRLNLVDLSSNTLILAFNFKK